MFILVGTSRIEYTGITVYNPEQLKALTVSNYTVTMETKVTGLSFDLRRTQCV